MNLTYYISLKIVCRVVVVISILSTPCLAEEFSPWTFRGLVMGKATVNDAIRLLGQPDNVSRDLRRGYNWIYYHDLGPVPGGVEMYARLKDDVVETVVVYPTRKLSVAEALRQLGPGFELRRYRFDSCLGKATEAPIYESPDGPLQFLVSPGKGMALMVEAGFVQSIEYGSQPIGSAVSQCNK
jgi:hypothetical protein